MIRMMLIFPALPWYKHIALVLSYKYVVSSTFLYEKKRYLKEFLLLVFDIIAESRPCSRVLGASTQGAAHRHNEICTDPPLRVD
jgi:hypothetical protein